MIVGGMNISCYGCGVCATACPQKAITIILSTDGFWVPTIDENICTECAICQKLCSYVDTAYCRPEDRLQEIKAYAVSHKSEEIRRLSTSGGAGYAIAACLNRQGYSLVGVKYDKEKHIAHHFVTDDLEEFRQTLNSKYLPSYTVDGFSCLMDGRKYAVFGTPCQIDSVRRWAKLRKKEKNFLFIDLFCHGVPSYLHWLSYLKYHIKKGEKLLYPVFRDKRNGWHIFTMSLQTDRRFISTTLQKNDFFQNIFFGNFSLNRSCYVCKYRGNNSAADLRMGDLWGGKYAGNEKGVTGVLVFTERGENVIEKLAECCDILPEKESVVLAGQLLEDLSVPSSRQRLLEGFRRGESLSLLYFRYAYRMWIKNLVPYRVKYLIKLFIYRLKKQ